MAHKNSLLTKRREPKPTNSACAEFANQKSQSLRIQLALNSLIRTPVSLAEKHSKAKTGKQSENSASPNSRVLAQGSCTRDGFFDAKTKLCATKNRHNYLKFCAFAKKNAVSLTNQGCKGCQNEALCHKKPA